MLHFKAPAEGRGFLFTSITKADGQVLAKFKIYVIVEPTRLQLQENTVVLLPVLANALDAVWPPE